MSKVTRIPSGLSVSRLLDTSVSRRGMKEMVIRITHANDAAEYDTTYDLPANALVREVLINVITAEATGGTKTLDVGLLSSESGGDADGFLDGVSVSSTGLKRSAVTFTTGLNQTYVASSTRGVLLSKTVAGADTAGRAGAYVEFPHLTSSVTAKSISVTCGSTDFAELVCDVIVIYDEIGQDV